jgi:hypothetical protein
MRRGSFGAQRIKTGGGAWPSASGRRRRHYFIMYVCTLTGIVCLIALSTQQAERQRTHLTPATPQDLQHSRANTDSHSSHNTQDTRVKKKYASLYAKEHSAQPDMFWRTHHIKPDPKPMRVMPLCLWGV